MSIENRDKLYKKFKEENPQTVGEKDKEFDTNNFCDFLCQKIDQLEREFESLSKSNRNLVRYNDVLQETNVKIRNKSQNLEKENKELKDGTCNCPNDDRIGSTKLWCCNICGKRQEEF